MKKRILLLLLALVFPVMAAEIDGRPTADREVADDIEIVSLTNGEIITRLVSHNGVTARQFWINSVYQQRESILVFQGQGAATLYSSVANSVQEDSRLAPGTPLVQGR